MGGNEETKDISAARQERAARRRADTTENLGRAVEHARLIAVGGSRTGCKYQVTHETRIGRASDCEVIIDNAECSRHHAKIRKAGDGYYVSDLGSRNGTMLNGARIVGEQEMTFGDRLRVGPEDIFLLTHHDPLEEQVLQRQRLETLGRLTAGVAHDLNNMLGGVLASVAFLRKLPGDARDGEEAEGCLDDISTAASRAADLAGRLLSFAKPTGGHAPANLSEIVEGAVQLARRTFDRAIGLTADVEPNLYIEGDHTQMHQVLMNLLINARDAVDGLGTITLTLSAGAGETVVLEVRDDGCGMDATTAAHVFEPFYTTKRARTGFGLGLTTVADIVKGHKGLSSVQSQLGEGAIFTITLPRVAPPVEGQASAALDELAEVERSAAGLHVAIVDDEPVMRRSLARIFRRSGFSLVTFERGEDLLAVVAEPNASLVVDALVLDLDLPGITGEETLRRLRAAGLEIAVVCVSGHHNPSREQDVAALGAAAFLAKPFDPSDLVAAVFEAIYPGRDVRDATTQ